MSALIVVPTASSSEEEFVWPDEADIQHVQYAHLLAADTDDTFDGINATKRSNISQGDGGLYMTTAGRVWIPEDACYLQLRICIVAHTGIGYHGGYRTYYREGKRGTLSRRRNGPGRLEGKVLNNAEVCRRDVPFMKSLSRRSRSRID
jgi:hypothetical protein